MTCASELWEITVWLHQWGSQFGVQNECISAIQLIKQIFSYVLKLERYSSSVKRCQKR